MVSIAQIKRLLSVFAITDDIMYDEKTDKFTIKLDVANIVKHEYNNINQNNWLEDAKQALEDTVDDFISHRFTDLESYTGMSYDIRTEDLKASAWSTQSSWNENTGGDPGDFGIDVNGSVTVSIEIDIRSVHMTDFAQALFGLEEGR